MYATDRIFKQNQVHTCFLVSSVSIGTKVIDEGAFHNIFINHFFVCVQKGRILLDASIVPSSFNSLRIHESSQYTSYAANGKKEAFANLKHCYKLL